MPNQIRIRQRVVQEEIMCNLRSSSMFLVMGLLLLIGCQNSEVADSKNADSALADQHHSETEVAENQVQGFKKVNRQLWAKPLRPIKQEDSPDTRFSVVDCGIKFRNKLDRENHLKFIETGSGVALADFDNDGYCDVYLLSTDGPNKLYRGLPNFQFEDVTSAAGNVNGSVDGQDAWGTGASFADIDNDGDLDLFVCNSNSRNIMYVNKGDGTFSDETSNCGLEFKGASKIGSFCDFDHDGDLDIYLLTNQVFEPKGEAKIRMVDGKPTVHPDYLGQFQLIGGRITHAGQRDLFYLNNGDGTFTECAQKIGIQGYDLGLSVTWLDFDHDGWKDIYVGNDFKTPDCLYRNNGDGTFSNIIGKVVQHTPWFSMGADAGDLNNDGLIDLMVADMSGSSHYKQKVNMGDMSDSGWFLMYGHPRQYMRNCLFVNSGTGRFMDQAFQCGLDSTDWTWAVRFADLDNNGWQDVFITNGHARNSNDSDLQIRMDKLKDEIDENELAQLGFDIPPLEESNLVYENTGNMNFNERGSEWGLNLNGVSHGAGFADFDNDGDLDIIVNNLKSDATVYRNNTHENHGVIVDLRGNQNRFGVGARVEIVADGQRQVKFLENVRGYLSSDEPVVHFGVPTRTIDSLIVTWPGGAVQEFTSLETGNRYRIFESQTQKVAAKEAKLEMASQIFADRSSEFGIDFDHSEVAFDDYRREPLLPYQLSQLGSGVTSGDVNGDGFPDVYFGGANGQTGKLFLNQNGQGFKEIGGPWLNDIRYEDMGILLVDIDGDQDLDLYLGSGSNEFEEGNEFLKDRIYLNDGAGKFSKPESQLIPDLSTSTSCVAAADYDRDGDLDLFVGSRSVPGKYPLTPASYLLKNSGKQFSNATEIDSVGLADVGLVNSAVWSDVNGDGWVDLLVALDWGPVSVFINESGKLENKTAEFGLASKTGWWHGIASADVDNDGDMDFVVTNQGLNTKYHANQEHPQRLYYADFDNSGTLDLVEAEFEGDTEFPVRGRSCSSRCMPFIAEKFETFHDFALASLNDIYEDSEERPFLEVNTLESVVLINQSGSYFEIRPLPRLAQSSPGFGVVCNDFDADGNVDVVIAQNFFGSQPETGYMDGGLSVYLKGLGDGYFEAMWPKFSGIELASDAMGLCASDLNLDGRVDLLAAVNNGPAKLLMNRVEPEKTSVRFDLDGLAPNFQAVGSRVVANYSDGKQRVCELSLGGSYLSGSITMVSFPAAGLNSITVIWPDGSIEEVDFTVGQNVIKISQNAGS